MEFYGLTALVLSARISSPILPCPLLGATVRTDCWGGVGLSKQPHRHLDSRIQLPNIRPLET